MKISIFGSGAWGTAIALLLHDNGNDVTLWSKFEQEADILRNTRENPLLKGVAIPQEILVTSDINKAAKDAAAAVMAVPSYAVRETAAALCRLIEPGCIVICVSKGIEKDTSSLFTKILKEIFGAHVPVVSVSGPTHAEEVAKRIPSGCVAASDDAEAADLVQELMLNDYFRVYTSSDIVGVELGAALKNVIALCAGVCDGLGFGDNTAAMLMTRGLAEMAELCVKMGGRKETIAGLAGLGDLIVTCISRHSRNRSAGVLIGKGMSVSEAMREVGATVEGYYAAKAAWELSLLTGADMPICSEAYKVLYEGKDALSAMRDLMRRTKKSEHDLGEEAWVTR